jgi:hypothetical protein
MSKEAIRKIALQMTVSKKTQKMWEDFCKENPGNHESRLLKLLELAKQKQGV